MKFFVCHETKMLSGDGQTLGQVLCEGKSCEGFPRHPIGNPRERS